MNNQFEKIVINAIKMYAAISKGDLLTINEDGSISIVDNTAAGSLRITTTPFSVILEYNQPRYPIYHTTTIFIHTCGTTLISSCRNVPLIDTSFTFEKDTHSLVVRLRAYCYRHKIDIPILTAILDLLDEICRQVVVGLMVTSEPIRTHTSDVIVNWTTSPAAFISFNAYGYFIKVEYDRYLVDNTAHINASYLLDVLDDPSEISVTIKTPLSFPLESVLKTVHDGVVRGLRNLAYTVTLSDELAQICLSLESLDATLNKPI